MLSLLDICDYISERTDVGEKILNGLVDEKTRKSISVFDNNRSLNSRTVLGGEENRRYRKQKITILVHWGNAQDEAMKKAYEIYALFKDISDIQLNSAHIAFFSAYEPQCIGYIGSKIYEYVIPVDIYVNKEE